MIKKIAFGLSILLAASLSGGFQKTEAASPHPSPGSGSVDSAPLSLGGFDTLCLPDGGSAAAESRNIVVGSHNQQVVHLQAENFSVASTLVQHLNAQTTIKQAIYFTLVTGTGDYLTVVVSYIPHGSVNEQTISFLTPNTKLPKTGAQSLFANGNGQFLIPVDSHNSGQGVPANAKLTKVLFGQLGQERDCTLQISEINHVIINGRAIGIDHSAPSSSCVQNCITESR